MIFLALETATSRQSMAIFRDQELLRSIECDSGCSLTPQIIPSLNQLLDEVSLKIADLEGLAISIGPGTFTGLRVGLATMTAFRLALGIPLVGVPTLEGLAWNVPNADLPIMSTISIRGDLVYWGRFHWQHGQLICLESDQMGNLPEICGSLTEPTIMLGDGWTHNKERLQSCSVSIIDGPSEAMWPTAKGIGQAGRVLLEQGEYLPEGCMPRYIQPSYAKMSKLSV